MLTKEDYTICLREILAIGLAFVILDASQLLANLFNVRLSLITLQLPVINVSWVLIKISLMGIVFDL